MHDELNRSIDYLRISITDRCNLRCVYCMPEKGVTLLPHEAVLRYEELERLCRIFGSLGITRYKITGGEPLVRKGVASLVRMLKKISGTTSVTLTTNGVLLAQQLNELVDAGMDGVNISLDTLEPDEFARITRIGDLKEVLRGLNRATAVPGLNVKLNCVPSRQTLHQVVPLMLLAKERPLTVRFIELMPIGLGKDVEGVTEDEICALLTEHFGTLTPCYETLGNGPAHYFDVPGLKGRVGFISAITHQFCDHCNRVRLTADGRLKTCLQYEGACDLRTMMRGGSSDEEIRQAIVNEINHKPARHHFTDKQDEGGKESRCMNGIGG